MLWPHFDIIVNVVPFMALLLLGYKRFRGRHWILVVNTGRVKHKWTQRGQGRSLMSCFHKRYLGRYFCPFFMMKFVLVCPSCCSRGAVPSTQGCSRRLQQAQNVSSKQLWGLSLRLLSNWIWVNWLQPSKHKLDSWQNWCWLFFPLSVRARAGRLK